MNAFAYCTLTSLNAVEQAVGFTPLTSPPTTAWNFKSEWLREKDFLYFRLHGVRETPGTWYGEYKNGKYIDAFNPINLAEVDLTGATVLIANCYGLDDPMLQTFYRNGAAAVIANGGRNYAGFRRVIGADLLAQWLMNGILAGLATESALRIAKLRLLVTSWRAPDRDALSFQILDNRR